MFIPLIAGFVVLVLVTIMIGWILDSSKRREAGRDRH
jgi:F0F1-type ATP synthase assembly protein I